MCSYSDNDDDMDNEDYLIYAADEVDNFAGTVTMEEYVPPKVNVKKDTSANYTIFDGNPKVENSVISEAPVETSSIMPVSEEASLSPLFNLDKDVAAFVHYIGVELQGIKDGYLRHLAKAKINSVLFEVVTGQYNNTNNMTSFETPSMPKHL